jgi:hypothetical protein
VSAHLGCIGNNRRQLEHVHFASTSPLQQPETHRVFKLQPPNPGEPTAAHEDVRFTLNVYAQSVRRRERMTEAERVEYDRAVEWASWASGAPSMGTNAQTNSSASLSAEVPAYDESGSTQPLR